MLPTAGRPRCRIRTARMLAIRTPPARADPIQALHSRLVRSEQRGRAPSMERSQSAQPTRRSVTILVPMYNEEAVLELFYAELNRVIETIPDIDFTYLFIDDGSRDASLSIVKNFATNDPRVDYLALSRNFGKERALL